jgi:hypothetical protein
MAKTDPKAAYKKLLEQNKKQMAAMRAKMQGQAKTLFSKLSKVLFKNNPTLTSFSWTQYTPYFNDGDVCEFSVNGNYPTLTFGEFEMDNKHYTTTWNGDKSVPVLLTEEQLQQNLTYEEVREFIGTFDEADLEAIFGDHIEVTVTPKGTSTEEYSHD